MGTEDARTIGARLRQIRKTRKKGDRCSGATPAAVDRSPLTTVIDLPETEHQRPVPGGGSNSVAISATCTTHRDGIGFTNLMVSKHDGGIKLDPHVAGLCVITLDEVAATALFDLLEEWLG